MRWTTSRLPLTSSPESATTASPPRLELIELVGLDAALALVAQGALQRDGGSHTTVSRQSGQDRQRLAPGRHLVAPRRLAQQRAQERRPGGPGRAQFVQTGQLLVAEGDLEGVLAGHAQGPPLARKLLFRPWARVDPVARIGSPWHRNASKESSMHAVVSTVTIHDQEAAEKHLREQVVPGVSRLPALSPATGPARTTPAWRWSSSNPRRPPTAWPRGSPRCFLT